MADFVFNVGKGRVAELMNRVNDNDPANSALIVALIASSGVEADAVLKDKDTFADVSSGTTDFATNTGGSRKTITSITVTIDDTADEVRCDIADQTWTGLANDGTGAISDIVMGYDDDTTAGTDADIEPLTFHDFPVTPDGSDVTAVIDVEGFFKATD